MFLHYTLCPLLLETINVLILSSSSIGIGNRSWKHFRNTGVQPLFVWFVLLNLFFDVVFSISFKHFLLSSHIRICRATYFYFQLILWDSYYSIFSFLYNVLKIIVCPFVLFILLVVCLSCFDIRLLITPLVSSNFSLAIGFHVPLLFDFECLDEGHTSNMLCTLKDIC
jgi:hypothetical protein